MINRVPTCKSCTLYPVTFLQILCPKIPSNIRMHGVPMPARVVGRVYRGGQGRDREVMGSTAGLGRLCCAVNMSVPRQKEFPTPTL